MLINGSPPELPDGLPPAAGPNADVADWFYALANHPPTRPLHPPPKARDCPRPLAAVAILWERQKGTEGARRQKSTRREKQRRMHTYLAKDLTEKQTQHQPTVPLHPRPQRVHAVIPRRLPPVKQCHPCPPFIGWVRRILVFGIPTAARGGQGVEGQTAS